MHYRKLNCAKLHSECTMLSDIQPRYQAVFARLTELCLRLLATKYISLPWLCRVFGIASHLSTVHSNCAIIVRV